MSPLPLPPTHRALLLITPNLSELPSDGEGADTQLGLQARPHGGVVVATDSPYDAAGLEVGALGEDHERSV